MITKMNPEVKALWLKALRSGEYQQGIGRLRNGDEYCCLGVLCDVYHKEKKVGGWIDRDDSRTKNFASTDAAFKSFYGTVIFPDPLIAEWSALSSTNPALPNPFFKGAIPLFPYKGDDNTKTIYESLPEREHMTLASLNDVRAPFEVIASIIEKEL